MKQAAILAGGRGTRLSQVFSDIPKSMVPIAGRPLLEIIVQGFDKTGGSSLSCSLAFNQSTSNPISGMDDVGILQ
jgi:D-glycero-alpha-D-manno-heptose 1-phosphate guanylyltransferase